MPGPSSPAAVGSQIGSQIGSVASFTVAPEDMVSDIREMIATLPADCALTAVAAYLTRNLSPAARRTNPVKIATVLMRDAQRLQSQLTRWDGDFGRLLPALAGATEALAEGIGAAADIAARHAIDPHQDEPALQRWGHLADHTAGAYDAVVGAAGLLSPPPPTGSPAAS